MFIATAYGLQYLLEEMPPSSQKLQRHEIMNRSWEKEHVFDSTSHYQYVATEVPIITPLQRFLVWTIYNPSVPIKVEWKRVGDFDRKDLIAAVKFGLVHDDDIFSNGLMAQM